MIFIWGRYSAILYSGLLSIIFFALGFQLNLNFYLAAFVFLGACILGYPGL